MGIENKMVVVAAVFIVTAGNFAVVEFELLIGIGIVGIGLVDAPTLRSIIASSTARPLGPTARAAQKPKALLRQVDGLDLPILQHQEGGGATFTLC